MKYRIDNITFSVSNVTLIESSIGSKVSLCLTYLDNEKEFVLATDNMQAFERAIKNKDFEKRDQALFRQVRRKLKNPVMD